MESILDKISTLQLETLSEIRHVRTRGHDLNLGHYNRPLKSLTLLPGLRLDTITVLGHNKERGHMNHDSRGAD